MKRKILILFLTVCIIFTFSANVFADELLSPGDVDAASFAGWTAANGDWSDWNAVGYLGGQFSKSPLDISDGDDNVYEFWPSGGSGTNNNTTVSKEIDIAGGTSYTLNASTYVYRSVSDSSASIEIQLYNGSTSEWTDGGTYSDSETGPIGPVPSWNTIEINSVAVSTDITKVKIILKATAGNPADSNIYVDFDDISLQLINASSLTVSVGDATADEADGTMNFTISLSDAQSSDVTVNYATADNKATLADGDYTNTSGIATIEAGHTATTVSVPINDDTHYESDENFFINISGASAGAITDNSGTGTIKNNDSPPTVTLSISGNQLDENGGVVTITATLSNRSYQNIAVDFNYTGTATGGGIDYTASATEITIPAESTSGTVTITGVDDSEVDPNETVIIGIVSVKRDAGEEYVEIGTGSEVPVTAVITDDEIGVSSLSPEDDATGVGINDNLVITFSKSVEVGTGNITIKKSADDSTVEAIDVTSSKVTGGGSDTITIDPDVELNENTGYYVQIAATAFEDISGNSYAGIADTTSWSFITEDITAPTVTSVNVPANDTYIAGESLNFTVNFDEAVIVAGGTPYIPVTLNTGGTVSASYVSGSGTNALIFRYTIQAGNLDTDGIAVGASISLNGAAIRDAAGNNAVLALNGVGLTTGVLVDGIVPEISSVNVPANGTYIAGQNLDFTVNFSKNVTVAVGTPHIPVTLNTGGTVNANYVNGTGTNALVFRYTVQTGNLDTDGIGVGAAIIQDGATIRDSVGNNAVLALNGVGVTTGVLVDGIVPEISSVNVPANGTFTAGQNLDFTVNFSKNVIVAGGTPHIPVTLNTGGTVSAGYVSGTGTNALVFRYTIQAGNLDTDGIGVGAAIVLNGAAIKDAAGNNAVLALNGVGATTGVLVDTIAPEVSSVNVPANGTYTAGQNLDFTVNFDEAVIVAGGTPHITVTLNTGGTVNANYISGTGTNALVFRYTVQAGNLDTDGIGVGAAIVLNGAAIKDAAGNNAVLALNGVGLTTGVLVDGIVPEVSSVNVPANGTYAAGQNLDFTVNFDEAVIVAGGTPHISVTLNTGGTVNANYISGTGTNALMFRYTVQAGNLDTDGIEIGAAIVLNGATIKDAAGNNAVLALNGVGATTGVLVDGIAPEVSSVNIPVSGTYIAGQNLDFTVNFDEAVIVAGGIPYIPVTLNTGGTVNAGYISGTGTNVLVFRYTIQAGNLDTDGIEAGAAIILNGATIRDAAGNSAVPALNGVGVTTGVLVDAADPEVSSVNVPANDTYIAGESLDFTVNFSENVTMAGGIPYIPVTLNTGGTVSAGYVSGAGTSALVFRYTVQTGNLDTDGIEVGAAIVLNGATIRDAAGNDAVLALNGVGVTTGVLVDTIASEVSSVNVPANGTYAAGQNLNFTVNFNESVTVAGGTPHIPVTLNTGGIVSAGYVSGTGTSALVFRYTVQAGNLDTDGIEVGAAIVLNGAIIRDAAGNSAVLTLNNVGSTAAVLVDTIASEVSSVGVPANGIYAAGQNLNFTVNFNENVTVAGGTPYIPVTLNTGGTVNANYVSGTGTNTLVFRYTIQTGNLDTDGIAVGTAIALNGATIRDTAGNSAVVALNNIGETGAVLVDAADPEVSSVGVPANGTYAIGQNLDFAVNFSENITIAGGTPYVPVTLNTGGTVGASYISGTGTNALVFRYTVQAGNLDTDGIAVGAAIVLNGSTIKDAAGNNAVSALNGVGVTTGVLIDGIAPEVSSVNVPANSTYTAGQNLDFTVNFSENVTVAGGTPYIPVTLNTGGTVNAGYISGTGTTSLILRYTIQEGNLDTDGIEVGAAISLNGAAIRDAAGNNAVPALNGVGVTTGVLVDGIVPEVSSVNVPVSGTYIAGQNLDFIVNFSENVTVAGGTPYIPVTLNTGGIVNAGYVNGTGTSALVFRYTVQTGDQDADGIEIGAAIILNGATIRDATTNNAVLVLNGVAATIGVLVDAADPEVSSVSVPANGTYAAGQNLDFAVNFSENVTVAGGTPYIPITLNTGGTVNASYISRTGTSTLVFRYTVQAGNLDTDGIGVGAAIVLNGATIKDTAANNAVLTLNNVGSTAAVLVDTIAPEVSSVNIPASDTYIAGENLDFTVNFNENVTIAGGTPHIAVTLNTGGTVNASYISGTGTNALVFRYTIQAGNLDTDGIDVGAAIVLNGATIRDAAANNAVPALNGIGATTGVLVDGIAPEVSSVNVPANGTYIAGQNLDFTVNFNENVTIAGGTPHIAVTLNTGGTVNASYISGTGTNTLVFRYTIQAGNLDTDGIEVGAAIVLNGATIKDAAENAAVLTLNNIGSTAAVKVDAEQPAIGTAALASSNAYMDISFSEGVYGASNGITPLTADKLAVDFTRNAGGADNVVINSVKKNNGAAEGQASALTGGETTVRVFLNITGTPTGVETIEITPSSGSSIYDAAGNSMSASQTTGIKTLYDAAAPTPGGSGAITAGAATTNTIELAWAAGTDNRTAPANLQYKVVRSTGNNIDTLVNAVLNGTTVRDWTANLASHKAEGLSSGTTYYFNVIIKDEAGNMAVYTATSKATTAQQNGESRSDDGSSSNTTTTNTPTTPTQTNNSAAEIIVNGQVQNAGIVSTTTVGSQTVTTITVDAQKIEEKLNAGGNNATVIIPVNVGSDVAVGVLSGQIIKNMENKEATLEIKTETVSYKVPASEINIDSISEQLGEQVQLKDIKVSITVSEPPADTVRIVEDTADRNNYQIVVEPVEFEITCSSGGKTVSASKFSGYVERTVAIPEGVDPSRITTGVVLNPDESFSHVPTTIVVIDGKYYARINSLTNSVYSVIWNPVAFKDVDGHWAKADINDMGSRLIISGAGSGNFEPEKAITRGEFAAIIVRALGLKSTVKNNAFADVKEGDWYYDYVLAASEYGLIGGYGGESFKPEQKITREEAMLIIARAMKLTRLDAGLKADETESILAQYGDGRLLSEWAKISAAACLKTGIASGRSGKLVMPGDNITKAETAVMIRRLLQKSRLI